MGGRDKMEDAPTWGIGVGQLQRLWLGGRCNLSERVGCRQGHADAMVGELLK